MTLFPVGVILLLAGVSEDIVMPVLLIAFVLLMLSALMFAIERHRVHRNSQIRSVILERINIDNGCLAFGDPSVPISGPVLRQVPNGRFDVHGKVMICDNIASLLEIAIEFVPEGTQIDMKAETSVGIDSGTMMIVDPIEFDSIADIDIALKKFRYEKASRVEDDNNLLKQVCIGFYSRSKCVGIALRPATGDGEYLINVGRDGDQVVKIRCEFA